MTQSERRLYLITELKKENRQYGNLPVPSDTAEQKYLLRALFNARPPKAASDEFLKIQDEYLKEETRLKGITDISALTPVQPDIYLWQGDITTLSCDAIVNAANSQLLGCFCPNHCCIDNAIHTFAGIKLRLACNEIMQKQGRKEPAGRAKITSAYNLPSRFVIHTVGPIVYGKPTDKHIGVFFGYKLYRLLCRVGTECYFGAVKPAFSQRFRQFYGVCGVIQLYNRHYACGGNFFN